MRKIFIGMPNSKAKAIQGVLSTGMIDKNGRTVYESDIIQMDAGGDRYVVYWSAFHCGLFAKPVDDDDGRYKIGLTNLRYWEVVESAVGHKDGRQ